MKLKFPRSAGWFLLGFVALLVIAADVTTTMFDTTYFSANNTSVSLKGSLTNWAKLATNQAAGGPAGGALSGTYPNPQVASGASITNANLVTPGVTGTDPSWNTNRPVLVPITFTASPSSAPTNAIDFHGIDLVSSSGSGNLNSLSRLYPFESEAEYTGSGAIGNLVAGMFAAQNSGIGNANSLYGLRILNQNKQTGVVTNHYGIHLENPLNPGGGTIQNNYGLWVEAQTSGSVNNYDIYAPGTNSYFGGRLLVAGDAVITGTNSSSYCWSFTIGTNPGKNAIQINQTHTTGWYPLAVTSLGAYGIQVATSLNSGVGLRLLKSGTGAGSVLQIQNKGTGLAIESGDGTNITFQVSADGTTTSTNGFGSYGVKTITTSATGATNTLTVNVVLYVTAATGASLTDSAGTTEFSGVAMASFTPVRLQPGGKFVGTSITYATGTASHAW